MSEKALDVMFRPNDSLGVQLFGLCGWNKLKGRVCGLSDYALTNGVPLVYGDASDLFIALFRPTKACSEMLGDSAISWLDRMTTSSGWWDTWMKAKDTGESIANLIPVAQPFVAAGQKLNSLTSSIWDMIRGKKSDDLTTTQKAGIGIGTVLLIAGAGYGVYYLTKKRKRRR